MYDHPTVTELLEAVRRLLDTDLLAAVHEDPQLYDQTQTAAALLTITQRELGLAAEHMQAEWQRLNYVQREHTPFPTIEIREALEARNRKLCDEITTGRYDDEPQRAALFEHLLATVRAQIEVTNPDFLKTLALEDQQS